MYELQITSDRTDVVFANGAKLYVSCASRVTIKIIIEGLLFDVESIPRGNHIVTLEPGTYAVESTGGIQCSGCIAHVIENPPVENITRDFELVCLKLISDPLVAPIKAWAMPMHTDLSDTVSTKLLSFDGVTELSIADYLVVECCC